MKVAVDRMQVVVGNYMNNWPFVVEWFSFDWNFDFIFCKGGDIYLRYDFMIHIFDKGLWVWNWSFFANWSSNLTMEQRWKGIIVELASHHICMRWFMTTFQKDFMSNKLFMKLMRWNGVGAKIQSSDDVMILKPIFVNNGIKFNRRERSASSM